MAFQWYVPAIILLAALLFVFVLVFIVIKCCCKGTKYTPVVAQEQLGSNVYDDEVKIDPDVVSVHSSIRSGSTIPMNLYPVYETQADGALSENEALLYAPSSETVSAYGDSTPFLSLERRKSNTTQPNSVTIQISLLFNDKIAGKAYVAGKIIKLKIGTKDTPFVQYKTHVVVLPAKKYALKTKWVDMEAKSALVSEYFKFTFNGRPESETVLRFRVYGRTGRQTMKKQTCLGECYVTLQEIRVAKGGLTVKRAVTKSATEVKSLK